MGAPIPLKNASDSYVSEKYPAKKYNNSTKLFMADGSAADTRYIYIYFGLPSGIFDTTLTNAKFRIYSGLGFGGSVTLSVHRLSQKFSANRVNWKNRPGVTGSPVQVTKSGAAKGTMWEFDVKAMLQTVANGTAWYGFRISATGSAAKWIYSAQAADQFRPELEIEWSDSPDAPERLIPDNGQMVSVTKPTLQWDFIDPSGDQTMQSASLRLFTSEVNAEANTSPALELLDHPITIPELDLDDTAYAGLAAEGTLWWRVLNTDGAGLPSAWSEPAFFKRRTKGSLTIDNPAVGSPAFVTDNTPPFSWTFTGRTQQKFEVILTTPETPAKWLWTSGIITSTETDITPPSGKITTIGKTYRLIIRIYDTENRVTIPDDPIYVEATRDFVYQLAPAVAPVTNLTTSVDNYLGKRTFEWDDATAPDEYVILRDGKEAFTEEPVDLFVSGTHYKIVDDEASPRKTHTWEVARKVNGETSDGNPTYTGTVKTVAPVLSLPGGGRPVVFLNPDVDAERVETSDIHYISGDAPPILVTQSIRGYEGSVVGVLANDVVPGLTADEMLENLEYFKDNPGMVLKLVWINKVMRVVVRGITDSPIANPDGSTEYLATFEFFETGF